MVTERGKKHTQIEVGLTPDQVEESWKRYELCGNMAKVARDMEVPYHQVRTALCRDQIRLYEISKCRAEEQACDWEVRERRSSEIAADVMNVLDGIMRHIKACAATGNMTDLINRHGKNMSVTEAYQWVLDSKQLDTLMKVSFTAAKISATLRQYSAPTPDRGILGTDPSKLSNDDLAKMVREMIEAGQPVPDSLRTWARSFVPELQ